MKIGAGMGVGGGGEILQSVPSRENAAPAHPAPANLVIFILSRLLLAHIFTRQAYMYLNQCSAEVLAGLKRALLYG